MQHFTLRDKTRNESLHHLYRADIGLILVIFKAEILVSFRDGLMSDCAMCEIKAAVRGRGAGGVVFFFLQDDKVLIFRTAWWPLAPGPSVCLL